MDHFSFGSQNPNSSSITSSCSSSLHNNNNKRKTRNTKRLASTKLSTDPQSVAARERRHRISARFKILQSMVPGGSKMDTVSMLDEAIGYVKYLKAQIWFHHNMLLYFNNHETKSSCSYVGEFEPVLFGRDDAYAPVMELHSQAMPLNVMDSEYFPWFQQEETMHRRRSLSQYCHMQQ